jgi:hypothetical protein
LSSQFAILSGNFLSLAFGKDKWGFWLDLITNLTIRERGLSQKKRGRAGTIGRNAD